MTASHNFNIVRATPQDRDAVMALWQRCGLVVSYNDPGADFDFAHGKANSDVLVGRLDGRVVASVMVGHDGHRGWLYYVAVAPEHQKQGFGAAMVAAGEAWLRARKVRKAMLLAREDNQAVQAFYETIGYEATPRVIMAKWLDGTSG